MTQRTRTLLKAAVGLTGLVAMGLYAYYGVHLKSRKETRARLEARLILELDKDEIQSLVVDLHGKRTRVERTGTDQARFPTWALSEPVEAPGDNISINSLLGTLERLESVRVLPDTQGVDLQSYGLHPPRGKLVLEAGKDKRQVLLVGKKSVFDNLLYVQPEGDPAVYLVRGDLEDSLLKNAYQLRLKELAPIDPGRATRLALKSKDHTIQLEKQDGVWRLTAPLEDRADAEVVGELLGSLARLRARSFRDHPQVALSHYGLDPPRLEIAAYAGSGQPVRRVALGKGDLRPGREVYYARSMEPPGPVAEIAQHQFEALLKKPLDLRARNLMEFDRQAVFKIKSASEGELLVLEKKLDDGSPDSGEAGWSLVSPRAAPVEPEAAGELLDRLAGLAVDQFLDEKDPGSWASGLDRPRRTISLYDRAGGQLAELKIGDNREQATLVAAGSRPRPCLVDRAQIERISSEFQRILEKTAGHGGSEKP